jgi:1,2-diacylglycerol 3-alpha-glucosyltransferase
MLTITHNISNIVILIIPMTVGIITNSYFPNMNGVAICVKNLELALINKGIKVVVITPKVPGVEYPEYVYPLPSAPAPQVMSKDLRLTITYNDSKILNFLRSHNVSILHSHDTIMGGQDTIMIGQELKIPVVHTYHTYLESYGYFTVPGYRLFIRNYSKFVCDYSDGVVVLSKKIEDYLEEINVKTKMYSLPNIYIPKTIESESLYKPHRFVEEYLLEHSFNILTFGRVAKEKNLINTIELVKPLFADYPKLRLIILGDGPMKEELIEYIYTNKLEHKVLLYGSYNYTDLATIAKVSKFYLNTSITEVLPTTALEATSLSLPLVCINDSAYSYILKDGINGLYLANTEITEGIVRLINNPEILKTMSINSYQAYLDYQNIDYGDQYIKMYQDVIINHRHKHISKKVLSAVTLSLKEFFDSFDLTMFDYWRK